MSHEAQLNDFLHSRRITTIYNIQALRAAAAFGIIIHHIIFSLNNYIAHSGIRLTVFSTGIDVFFVISGFIMAGTTEARSPSPGQFALSRIVRIVPIYWLLTGLVMLLGLAGFKALEGPHADVILLVKSLLFIADPHRDPILFVGWSLNYEMMFYAIFALCLFLHGVRLRVGVLVGAIVGLWLLGMTFPDGSYIRYMADGRILEFALGVLLWHASAKYLLPSWAAFACLALGLAGLLLPDLGVRSALALPISALLLVYAAVSLEERGFSVGRGFWKRQGDASYSTYLTHSFVIVILSKLAIVSHLNASTAGIAIAVAVMFPAAATLGTLFHRKVEVPLTEWVRGLAKPRQLAVA